MPVVPHLAFPIRLGANGHLAVVEQDSVDDITACVEVLLRTRIGELDYHPAFGTSDLAFQQQPVDRDRLLAQIEAWEPRARLLIDEAPDRLDALLVHLNIYASSGG